MHRKLISKASAVIVATATCFLIIPGCVIEIGPENDDNGAGGTTNQTSSNEAPPPPATDDRADDELLAAVNRQTLTFASATATISTLELQAVMDALPVDPASLDDAMVIALM